MKKSPYRIDKIKKFLHREIANLVSTLKDPRANNITITEVEVSPDLKKAKVYFTTIDKNSVEEINSMFLSAKGFIRSKVAQKLNLKHAIDLEFVYDTFVEKTSRVLFLLDKIKDEMDNNKVKK